LYTVIWYRILLSDDDHRLALTVSGAVPSRFRGRLRSGDVLVGSFVNLGSPLTAEIMGIAGFDWLVLDLEHGAGDEGALLAQLQALSHTGVAAIARVEAIERPRFNRALDLGADGVLVPRLHSVEDARRCVEFCRYGGSRGVAAYNRSWHWGLGTRTLDAADEEVVCAVQIETAEALDAVEAIAAVEGVDVVFVGPVDLAHSLGLTCAPDDPELVQRAAAVAQAARAHGKAAGMLVGSVAQAEPYLEAGFTFIGCNSDSGLLAQSSRTLARALRQRAQNGPAAEQAIPVVDAP
jgi:2-keto-3-deoxy-L-rhamnonate aldolase RhmA